MKWRTRSNICIRAQSASFWRIDFTPAQFALLQSRLPFTLATNQVEISPVHQPLLLDGTLDQLQQLRVRPMAWSCLGGRLFNDDYFQPLRDELAVVAEELNAGSVPSNRWFTPGYYVYRRSRCQLSAQVKLSAYGQLSKQKH